MVTRREIEVVNSLKAKGCVEFPFSITFGPGRILENTPQGAGVKKLAADNGIMPCPAKPEPTKATTPEMRLIEACKIKVESKDSIIEEFIVSSIEDGSSDCIPNRLICVLNDHNLVGACIKYSSDLGVEGSLCTC